jgi:rhodanese-related sulfurtransferase
MKHFQQQRVVFFVMALFVASLTGCAGTKQCGPFTVQELEAKAARHVISITAEQAKAELEAGEFAVILDVREPQEYKMGHIPNAVNIPRGVLEYKIGGIISDKNTPILVYCKVGGRGTFAAEVLGKLGYTSVVNLGGGWEAWETAGYPVE